MANKPELTIKVNVDPYIDPQQVRGTIERKVNTLNETNPPKIKLKPDMTDFQSAITNNLGGPYDVDLKPNLTENIEDKVVAEIGKIDTEKLKIDIKPDLEGFSTQLSETLRDELKQVNQKLSYYLKNLTSNSNNLTSLVDDILPIKKVKSSAKQAANEVSDEFTGGLSKFISVNDFFNYNISDKTKKRTLAQAKNLVQELRDGIDDLRSGKDNWTDDLQFIPDNFNKNFSDLKNKAIELRSIVTSFGDALSADEFKDVLKVFDSNNYNLTSKTGSFSSLEDFLDAIISKGNTVFKTENQVNNFFESLENLTGNKKISMDTIFGDAVNELTGVQQKITEINADIKTSREEISKTQKTLQQNQKDDTSGHLDAATIETYGRKLDEVLSNISAKQGEINEKRQAAVGFERSILQANILTREGLSRELAEYDALFKKYDTDKISKFADSVNLAEFIKNQETKMQAAQESCEKNQIEDGVYNVTDVKFNINPEVLQLKVDQAFKDISAPIDLHLKKDAAKHVRDELSESLNNSNVPDTLKNNNQNTTSTVPVHGKVTITDADVIVDVKNPVSIPGTVTVDPTSVQLGNSDDLQKNADALSSVKQSLSKISTSAENYGTKIAAIGPSVQYVAQEVDNLSKSLENQITDLDLIAKKTDAYGTTANSITLNTKDVAVAGDPVDVPVKATLEKTKITVPEEAVDIKVKGVLATEDK